VIYSIFSIQKENDKNKTNKKTPEKYLSGVLLIRAKV
jgi:hypothetical protein